MTATETIETPWDGDGPPPIFEADRLIARLQAIPADRQQDLIEAWNAQGIGAFPPGLVTADRYAQVERLVQAYEPSAPADFAHVLAVEHESYAALPEHVRQATAEALRVYAGMEDPTRWLLTSTGRLGEVQRIVGEAVAYAQTLPALDVPSVADLPPVDDEAPQVASEDYPGAKAKADVIERWVNYPADETARLNRAARAYAIEQDRATVRKGLSAKLVEILGPEGLAKVNEALAAAAPAPLDLGAPGVEAEGAAGDSVPAEEVSSEVPATALAVEAQPAAPQPTAISTGGPVEWDIRDVKREALEQIAYLHGEMAKAYAELAGVA